ncbi:HxlR family transcriptional regulator protein [Marine Group I thaumarchaeote SCGC AAA799-E16]|uniref:HxlR family transcriptional regulator protein n=6 Tax=Marine Group I TaxID=905826 RepID=A0A087S6J8_9ARCH|nr:HxlR family transcriptional regulator protein [Marine Group I thaumarchaeote SCGC AAA799-N04]KER06131.1 HxlR family transcriptional regulator protein [Marine Group I thaumarchaeote SCGC AAA799-E16]KFM15867.1 HxlR family transcriptional regulator protein [Marine Group I thaumarchaeote SCGC AAA799-D11]KFM17432.1 HxlR family transcriptional regulator protein [Marine Group I thaumarchaeote SCGC RSA3]KFM20280.1 HxlR family transcriptional regulator protein [Marine Group I thaumarchaeote SCGC AAA7
MVDFLVEDCKCCPIDNTFKIIGKKFTIHILRNMVILNQHRFNEFINSVEGINPNTLSTRLKEMEQGGLIEKNIYNETPIRIEYDLTKKGKALQPILEEMAKFSAKFCCDEIFVDAKPRTFTQVYGKNLPIVN